MSICTQSATLQHISKAVFHHSWVDLEDWVDGLDELSSLSDSEIELIASAEVPNNPTVNSDTPRLAVRSETPHGLTYDQQATYVLLLLKGLSRLEALVETVGMQVAA